MTNVGNPRIYPSPILPKVVAIPLRASHSCDPRDHQSKHPSPVHIKHPPETMMDVGDQRKHIYIYVCGTIEWGCSI